MDAKKMATVLALSIAAAACGQGDSDNVMSPEANALEPADVNAALGPEVTTTPEANAAANDMNGVDNSANGAEPTVNNATE